MKAGSHTTYASKHALGDRVFLGDDEHTVATVTGIMWKPDGQQIEVQWMNNGVFYSVWVHPLVVRPATR